MLYINKDSIKVKSVRNDYVEILRSQQKDIFREAGQFKNKWEKKYWDLKNCFQCVKKKIFKQFELKNNINPYYEELQLSDAKDDDELKQMYSKIHDNWDDPKWRDEFVTMLRKRYDSKPRKDNLVNISEKKKRAKKLSEYIWRF